MQAAAWAAELASLCSQRGDSRTGLEAEAYVAWMAGVLEMERARDWQAAVASLQRSKCVFGASAHAPLTTTLTISHVHVLAGYIA